MNHTFLSRLVFTTSIMFVTALSISLSGCPPETATGASGDSGGGSGNESGGGGADSQVIAMEDEAHDALNAERASRDIAALTMRDDLRLVARAHSEDMVARDFFDHTNPDGKDPFERMADAEITYSTAGENIAWNSFPDPVATAVDGWMNSTGHRNNILNGSFTHAGMGVASDGKGGHYFTQVFTGGGKAHIEFLEFYLPPPLALDVDGR
jgi:uncharacterized protein YkwD